MNTTKTQMLLSLLQVCGLLGLALAAFIFIGPQSATQQASSPKARYAFPSTPEGKEAKPAAVQKIQSDSSPVGDLSPASEIAPVSFPISNYSPNQVSPGFTLIPLTGTATVGLFNLTGEQVHAWAVDASRARLLPNGNLLVVHGSKWGLSKEPWKSMRPTVAEYDWNGKLVWQHSVPDIAHHDIQRLPNGNTIFPYRVIVPTSVKKGILDESRRRMKIRSDAIIEVTPTGDEVWRWDAHEYLDINSCGQKPCPTSDVGADHRMNDWTHINTVTVIPENKWFDQGDQRFKPGNILTLPRNWWTILLIDKQSKEVTWRYEGDYKGGLSGGHEAYMIPKGLPGAGNIMVFDNGRVTHAGESYVLEIDPTTKKVVWQYDAGKSFFSKSAGSMQRFKNGNTLISEDVRGRVFEVTPEGETVWELTTPLRLSRSERYDYDFCPQMKQLSKG